MKKKLNLSKEEEKQEKFKKLRSTYVQFIDGLIRGSIAFIIFGIIGFLVFVYLFKFPPYYFLPFALIGGVIISPFLSKVKLGEKILTKYEQWLLKITTK